MTLDDLRKHFVYEPDTGMLRKIVGARKPYPWRKLGKGYLATTWRGTSYYLHQLVWLWHHGYIPERLDHRDRDKTNCRIGNLRECTPAQNQYNTAKKANNSSGFKGVVFHGNVKRRPWQAKIVVEKQVISLGYFADREDAARAYEVAAAHYAKEFAGPSVFGEETACQATPNVL